MKNEKKIGFSGEMIYVLGIVFLTLGCACMERADFGMSMVVAPAYLLYRKLSLSFSFVTFGMMEYTLQAVLLLGMCICIRRFRISYLFSFVTAVLYGLTLNGSMVLIGMIPGSSMALRVVLFVLGVLLCSFGVACCLHTYIAPEVYELICKEVPARFNLDLVRFKTIYDVVSCLVAVIMSFVFFGFGVFEGVKWGTLLCALINGRMIGMFSAWMDEHLQMMDVLPLRPLFDK